MTTVNNDPIEEAEVIENETSLLDKIKEKFPAAGPNELVNTENQKGQIAGFWPGFWHGLTAPIAFFISLFKDDVNVYEVHNNGKWYNFGFILGLMIGLGGNSGATSKAMKPKGPEIK